MTTTLTGKSALVTGSTSGIGAAIARRLAGDGAHVVVSGRSAQRGEAVVADIVAKGGQATFVQADLGAGEAAVRSLADAASSAVGGDIDVLVNNAAVIIHPAPTGEVTGETITQALAVNVTAPFLLTGILATKMAAKGHGSVINIGSINGLVGMAQVALYSTTKAAIHSLTLSWAAEFAIQGVNVNTVAPGPTATEGNLAIEEMLAPIIAAIPSGRMSTPEEIAAVVAFLASEAGSNIHGSTIAVDGGYSIV
jgi:NAD(P)-dependent dehydrogenase (short-subunit alcohol dehydrogenase family)